MSKRAKTEQEDPREALEARIATLEAKVAELMAERQRAELLTVAQTAGMLALCQQTIRNWIDEGAMPAVRVGRRVLVKRVDIDRIVAEGYNGGHEHAALDFWAGDLEVVA